MAVWRCLGLGLALSLISGCKGAPRDFSTAKGGTAGQGGGASAHGGTVSTGGVGGLDAGAVVGGAGGDGTTAGIAGEAGAGCANACPKDCVYDLDNYDSNCVYAP